METWIKIDELRPIVESLSNKKITYGKAIELITEHCRSRVESSKLSQHDVIKNEVAVCDHKWKEWEDRHCNARWRCSRCKEVR